MMRSESGSFHSLRKQKLLSVIDIGSSKIVCIIARLYPLERGENLHPSLPGRSHRVEVLGFGIQKSRGIKAGVVVDMRATEQAVRLAVDAAERMCGLVVDSVLVNFSSRQQKSHHIETHLPIEGKVDRRDIRRLLAQGSKAVFGLERPVLYSLPTSFSLDGEQEIGDPLDMIAESLKLDLHVVSAEASQLRNLEQCINQAHLGVEAVVPTALVSGLSVFVGDEARLGACCIDMGAGTTNLAIFTDDKFVHGETLAVGGHHITMDIARLLSISVEEAERLKVLHGSVLEVGTQDHELISLSRLEGDGGLPGQYPRPLLTRIIRARVEEIFEMVRDRLQRYRVRAPVNMRFVLTGGGAGLTGMSAVAGRLLGGHVRTGRPLGVSGLPENARGSAFSVASGLLIYPQFYGFETQATQWPFIGHETLDSSMVKRGFAPLARARKFLKAL